VKNRRIVITLLLALSSGLGCASTVGGGSQTNWQSCRTSDDCKAGMVCVEQRCEHAEAGIADRRIAKPEVAGIACKQTNESGSFAAEEGGHLVLGCDAVDAAARATPAPGTVVSGPWELVREGRIGAVSADSFELSSCAGDAGCAGAPVRFTVTAAGLDLRTALPDGALARVRGSVSFFLSSCVSQGLWIESLDSLAGETNPAPAKAGLYLALSLGGGGFKELPFRMDTDWLACAPPALPDQPGAYSQPYACGDETLWVGLYVFRIVPARAGSPETRIPMGDTVTIPLGGTTERWRAHDLQSYQTAFCDDYSRWAYWVALDRSTTP
jgi:hypothetical protein